MEYKLLRMTDGDAAETADWMVRQYGFERGEVEVWIRDLHFDWPLSVKAVDANGHTIGLLNMSSYRIEEETPLMDTERPQLLRWFDTLCYTAVFSFIVATEYRGTRLNYDMFMSILPELRRRFDFVFIPVLHRLKTHSYWKRWGAVEFYRDAECVYYAMFLDPSLIKAAPCDLRGTGT